MSQRDGWSVGVAIGRDLAPEVRRGAAAALLAREDVVVCFQADGFRWSVPSGDRILADMLVKGSYEGRELRALLGWVESRPELKSRSTVVEVGANIGTTTLPLTRSGFRVLAVEPIARSYSLLIENLTTNGLLESVIAVRAACSRSSGVLTMRVANGGSSEVVTGTTSDIARKWGPDYLRFRGTGHEESVTALPLNGLLRQAGVEPDQVAFVWSDTEGHETDVLATGSELWEAGVPVWIELWPSGLEQHAGLASFSREAERYFSFFIESSELLAKGPSAAPRPIRELRGFLNRQLSAMPVWWSTDALLISKSDGS